MPYLEVLLADSQFPQQSPNLDRHVRPHSGSLCRQGRLGATAEPTGESLLDEQEGGRGDAFRSERTSGQCSEVSSEQSVQDELCGRRGRGFFSGGDSGHD